MAERLIKLPNNVIRSALYETVEKKLNSKNYSISINSALQAGESNFLGVVYRASFKGKEKNECENENNKSPVHKVIIKVAPLNPIRKRFLRPGFLREIYMYNEVLPALRRFEQSKCADPEINFKDYAQCYRTVDMEFSECLLLEDLDARGFVMLDRCHEDITVEHIRLLMRSLAKLHAISFAMKDQQPEQFQELVRDFDEVYLAKERQIDRDYYLHQANYIKKLVSREGDAHLMARVEKLFEIEPMDIAMNCIDPKISGCAVISHGDTWDYNLMFRYDDNGKPIEISLLDWQMSRYSSPVIDILFFMFLCTKKKLRDAHYDEFLNCYHEQLSLNIRKLGSDPDELYSYEMMQEEFRKFGRFGLIIASAALPVILKDHGQDLEKVIDEKQDTTTRIKDALNNLFTSDKSRARFEQRLRDVVVDMARLEYI